MVSTYGIGGHHARSQTSERRRRGAQLKARVLAACEQPGASVARVALEHGLNANLVHRWRRIAEGRERGPHGARRVEEFVPVPMTAVRELGAVSEQIRIEVCRAGTVVTVTWPVSGASASAAWLRELLR